MILIMYMCVRLSKIQAHNFKSLSRYIHVYIHVFISVGFMYVRVYTCTCTCAVLYHEVLASFPDSPLVAYI